MPITQGAKKAHRVSEKKYVFNKRRKDVMKAKVRAVRDAVLAKDASGAKEKLSEAYKAIDKAKKRGVIKENTASRKKSRLVKAIQKIK